MELRNIKDITGFFEMIDSCKGRVELISGEGDRLNLKSKLCQYVALANVLSSVDIPELDLIAYEEGDKKKIIDFMGKQ